MANFNKHNTKNLMTIDLTGDDDDEDGKKNSSQKSSTSNTNSIFGARQKNADDNQLVRMQAHDQEVKRRYNFRLLL